MPIMAKDWAFCRWLALEYGVIAIPTSPFYSQETREKRRRRLLRQGQHDDDDVGGRKSDDDTSSSSTSSSGRNDDDGSSQQKKKQKSLVRFTFCKTDETLDKAALAFRKLGQDQQRGKESESKEAVGR